MAHANRRQVTLATPVAALIAAMDCKAAIAAQTGTKFVAGDGKFMFEYPDRWAVAIVRFMMNASASTFARRPGSVSFKGMQDRNRP